ncbi:tripartite tricarboxylate transporter substrate binding protein [Pseudorhodoferax sp. Leaf265]|uniref:Bug family tripartite tricarboxylate transporter substrate binding protein n=1 Tax=Pseudorhodoferax sp. Leaf265 TaxID=1736315 RepID=UPI0006FB4131|nr:tripartite tricarboxylate transporter substrate binding protein [Pseudorhodoferax sp. Leaf265]KQP06149.1 hypothetical protein ASF45_08670 [Pseudorhodoferax sp. Leaf265]
MHTGNRHLLRSLAAGIGIALAGLASACAQNFPTRPVTVVVPFSPGGAADVVARVLAQNVHLKQPVVIDNKPGAGGTIAAAAVAKAAPDGHTVLFITAGHAGQRALYPKLSYDPVADFTPLMGVSQSPIVIAVKADAPYRTIGDFVEAARKRPGKLNCAGGGGGATVTNLAFEQMKADLRLDIAAVPYKGSAPALTALLGGEIDCDSDNVSAMLPMVSAGKVRILAVMNKSRASLLPDVPTVAETVLPSMEASAWFGILLPKGTQPAVVEELRKQFATALGTPQC